DMPKVALKNGNGKNGKHSKNGASLTPEELIPLESEDGFFVYGFSGSFSTEGLDAFLLKINKQGDSLWMKSYGDEDQQYGWGMTYDQNGNIVAVGQTASEGQLPDIWITKIDSEGNMIWENTLGTPERSDRAFFIEKTADNNFVITGLSAQHEKKDDDVYAAKFSSEGKIIWEKIIDYGAYELGHTIRTYNKHLYIFGYTMPENDSLNHPMLVKLTQSGKVEWKKVYTSIPGHARVIHGDFSDHGIIMTGYHKPPGKVDFDTMALLTNREGQLLGYRDYGGNGWDMGYSVIFLNGSFAVIGHESISDKNIDLLLVIDNLKTL
ncbi:MAG: hypothetical protein R3345_10940, partial [Fulvivirga sp.]|nr:hypothetical protein [Fulvivirga sp.]